MKDPKTELWLAIGRLQAKLKNPEKTKDNPFHRSKYADLSDDWDAVQSLLAAEKLTVIQRPFIIKGEDGHEGLETIVIHAATGLSTSCNGRIVIAENKKGDPQAKKSATTYERRRQFECILMIAPRGEDDDGNVAAGKGRQQKVSEADPLDARWFGTGPKPVERPPANYAKKIWSVARARAKVLAMRREFTDADMEAMVRDVLALAGYESTKEVTQEHLDGICDALNSYEPAEG